MHRRSAIGVRHWPAGTAGHPDRPSAAALRQARSDRRSKPPPELNRPSRPAEPAAAARAELAVAPPAARAVARSSGRRPRRCGGVPLGQHLPCRHRRIRPLGHRISGAGQQHARHAPILGPSRHPHRGVRTATHRRLEHALSLSYMDFIWIKDVLRMMVHDDQIRPLPIKPIARTPLFVPNTKEIGALFSDMQRQKAQMAIVLDEYGGTAGMLTIEELIEEVVGRVSDELTGIAPQVRRIADGQVEADAMLRVDEANAQLGIRLPESDDYDTLAGLLMAVLGRVPIKGEAARVGNLKLYRYGDAGTENSKSDDHEGKVVGARAGRQPNNVARHGTCPTHASRPASWLTANRLCAIQKHRRCENRKSVRPGLWAAESLKIHGCERRTEG